MSSKIDPALLKDPDAFISISDHVFDFIERHFKVVLAIFVIVLITSLVYVGLNYWQAVSEQKAADAIYKPEAALKKAESDVREERAKKMQNIGIGKAAAKDVMVRPADFNKDYAALVEQVKAEIVKHSDTKAALVSALNLSYFLSEQKQYAAALDIITAVKYRPAADELLNGFLQMHQAIALTENNRLDPAVEIYQRVIDNSSLKPFHPEAILKMGVVLQLKGDAEKARAAYEKVSREFPESEASTTAQRYLRLLNSQVSKQG